MSERFGCGHFGEPSPGRVCEHLLASHDLDQWRRFTGAGKSFDLVCSACAREPEQNAGSGIGQRAPRMAEPILYQLYTHDEAVSLLGSTADARGLSGELLGIGYGPRQ